MIGPKFYDVNDWQTGRKLHTGKYSTCCNFSLVDQCTLIQVVYVSCMVSGCFNRVKQNGISFYRLPVKDFTGLQKRLNNMKLKNLHQWFLNLLEVPNPSSFMQEHTEPFLKIQKIFMNELEPKVSYASVAHKIILFKEIKPKKHELHSKTQLIKYLRQINKYPRW